MLLLISGSQLLPLCIKPLGLLLGIFTDGTKYDDSATVITSLILDEDTAHSVFLQNPLSYTHRVHFPHRTTVQRELRRFNNDW